MSEQEATDRLYRREINQVGSKRRYQPACEPGPNTVVIKRLENFEGVDVVVYTEIAANISDLSAENLASLAIQSARELGHRDGISYLMDAKAAGIVTPLTTAYEQETKRQSRASDLEEALRKAAFWNRHRASWPSPAADVAAEGARLRARSLISASVAMVRTDGCPAPEVVNTAPGGIDHEGRLNKASEGDLAALRLVLDQVYPVRDASMAELLEEIKELRNLVEARRTAASLD